MCRTPLQAGFSLLETAIVLVILGILLEAALVPLASLEATRRERALAADLVSIRDALIARLVADGALPCPLASQPRGSSGAAVDDTRPGLCTAWRGGVPATALAWPGPRDARGAALDPWGRPYRYALSDANAAARGDPALPDWSVPGEPSAVGIAALQGSLSVCAVAATRCAARDLVADDLAFVVLSQGADARGEYAQAYNLAERGAFVSLPRSSHADRPFDDALTWASRGELVWWLLRADRLP